MAGNGTLILIALWLALLSACAPQPAPGRSTQSASQPPASAQATAPKVLTLGVLKENPSFGDFDSSTSGVIAPDLAHNLLVVRNQVGAYLPQLATEQLSVERGTWRLNADGTMDTTWKIQPNVTWQDGSPFTSDDLVFTYTVYRDPELPSTVASMMQRMESVSAPDPTTFVVHWSVADVKADQAPGLRPLPRHLLEETYRADKHSLPNNPYFTTEFVGLGPYRLVKWDTGVQMTLTRNEGYYRGRPPLDTVVLRFIGDPNALAANLLAGAIDMATSPGIGVEDALQIKQQWEGTANRVVFGTGDSINWLQFQQRAEYAQPRSALLNRDVREALYRSLDRAAIADVITHGLAPLADSWVSPGDPLRPAVESAIPQYPYDPGRAQQLFTAAGWTRGTDGVLVNAQTGETFALELWGQQQQPDIREQPIIADYWKAVGVQAGQQTMSNNASGDREYDATRPGIRVGSIGNYRFSYDNALSTKEVAGQANRWNGRNKYGYSNPAVDALVDKLNVTIDSRSRATLMRDYLQTAMGDVAFMPIYWEVYSIVSQGSVKGAFNPSKTDMSWNAFEWDKE
jgi:peptide/nickel transport system substrate-binding protein